MSAAQSLAEYVAAQGSGDVDDVLRHLADDAGRSSEGVRLAERAGTLPPAPPS